MISSPIFAVESRARAFAPGPLSLLSPLADRTPRRVEPTLRLIEIAAPQNEFSDPRQNRLLAALPAVEQSRWWPLLEAVDLVAGEVLCESGSKAFHVYFPTTAIVSLQYVTEQGASVELAGVGFEGLIGVSLFMGGVSTTSRAVVQSAGWAFRLPADVMLDEFNRTGAVMSLLLRYTQALITQMTQTAACNRHHSLDQRLSRWLLLSLDRLRGKDMVRTQELIANALGVRRESVTEAAGRLQEAGVISYRRGHISVHDRAQLEHRSCECYAVVKTESDRLLPAATPASPQPQWRIEVVSSHPRGLPHENPSPGDHRLHPLPVVDQRPGRLQRLEQNRRPEGR